MIYEFKVYFDNYHCSNAFFQFILGGGGGGGGGGGYIEKNEMILFYVYVFCRS